MPEYQNVLSNPSITFWQKTCIVAHWSIDITYDNHGIVDNLQSWTNAIWFNIVQKYEHILTKSAINCLKMSKINAHYEKHPKTFSVQNSYRLSFFFGTRVKACGRWRSVTCSISSVIWSFFRLLKQCFVYFY